MDDNQTFYCEMVDEEGNRHWSDVVHSADAETAADDAVSFASCEFGEFVGMSMKLYPIFLSAPVIERDLSGVVA